jgi:DNA-binding SARP family transcriptional activator/Tfp pilus assembly protein PilF
MRFRILGPLEVWSENRWTDISAAKWRSLLACLLLHQGQLVSTDALIVELWGDSPPARANNLVSIYVHRLRRLIGDSEGKVLVYRAPGYLLRVSSGDLDLQEFDSLVAEGRRELAAGEPERAAGALAQAQALWRGPLLADVLASPTIATEAERARELRLAAAELRVEAELACGRSAQAVPELRRLVAENPIRERLWLLLMRALMAAGRHAEALDTYSQARQIISDELGVDPGPELQQLYQELLAADASSAPRKRPPSPAVSVPPRRPAVDLSGAIPLPEAKQAERDQAPAASTAAETPVNEVQGTIAIGSISETIPESDAPASATTAAGPMPSPAQLPADIGDFTGRDAHVRHLCQMLVQEDAGSNPGAVRIAVVAGTAGLGKTTLAVHAAHQVRASFPDGQLYVDLLGASAQPADPGEVLARFLRDLGVDGDKVPARDDERAALFRTRLTGRRVLLLLDNAKDAAQVRPLLPGSASCAVLVTTRNSTPDLASTKFVDLNVLEDTEALALFSRIVDDPRPAAEPDATAEVLLACAGLPLAIRICAARLAARRQWKIATMANRLRDERRRLDELETGDLAVRASFKVSYDALRAAKNGVDPARAFRLLGLWRGQSISLPAAAALLRDPEDQVEDALEALVDANLLESPADYQYRFHDLLRFYATERAREEESAAARDEAVGSLLRWYTATADAGSSVVSPYRYRIPLEDTPGVTPLVFTSVEEALQWYDSERVNVIHAVRQAAEMGLHEVAWRLPTALSVLFNRLDNQVDCITANRIAVESARAAGDRRGEAWALQSLGAALIRIRDSEALEVLEQALLIRSEIGDRMGEAQTAISLADAYHKQQGPQAAFERSLACLKVLREVGNAPLLGTGLNNHGEYCLELGKLDEAAACFTEAREIWREIGAYGQGYALHNLGRVYLESGRPEDAIACLMQAHPLHQASGDLIGQATTLKYLGLARHATGDKDGARQALMAALAIFEGIGSDADVEDVKSALAALLTPAM